MKYDSLRYLVEPEWTQFLLMAPRHVYIVAFQHDSGIADSAFKVDNGLNEHSNE